MNKHIIALVLKKLFFGKIENYIFNGIKLKFKTGTRPIKRKYLNSSNSVVRNDVLQINYFEQFFTAHDILWDIGSHNGHYAIFAASIVNSNNHVYAFEPDSVAREVLIENISLNKFENKINLLPYAISNVNGFVNFDEQSGNANSRIVKNSNFTNKSVESYTLNSILNFAPLPTFIKIDVEGAEIDILNEASQLLSSDNIKFIVELHPFAWDEFKVNYNMLLQLLQKYNRDIQPLDPSRNKTDLPFYGTVIF